MDVEKTARELYIIVLLLALASPVFVESYYVGGLTLLFWSVLQVFGICFMVGITVFLILYGPVPMGRKEVE